MFSEFDKPGLALAAVSSLAAFGAAYLGALWFGAAWDEVSKRYVTDLLGHMRALNLSEQAVRRWMRIWGWGLLGCFIVLGLLLRMPLLAAAIDVLMLLAPRYVLRYLVEKRKTLLRDQMVGATVALANASRAGLSLAQGLATIGAETPEPLAAEIRRISNEYERGRPLQEAIETTRRRLDIDAFTLFASAIQTSLDRGGKITEALERISHSLQENQRLERKLAADTESGRQVVVILALFPLAFLGGFYLLDPYGVGLLFSTLVGQATLIFIGALVYASVRWSVSILNIDI
jgi:tight adherence protein B